MAKYNKVNVTKCIFNVDDRTEVSTLQNSEREQRSSDEFSVRFDRRTLLDIGGSTRSGECQHFWNISSACNKSH